VRSLLKRWKPSRTRSYETQAASEAAFWGDFTARWIATGIIPPWADIRLALGQAISLGHRDRVLGGELENLSRKLRFLREALSRVASLASRQPTRVLDLGCGAGFLSLEMARQGADVLGVDLSPGQIAVARYFGDNGVRWSRALYPVYQGLDLKADRFKPPSYRVLDLNQEQPAGPFNVLFAHDAVHHLGQPEQILKNLRSVLEAKGFVFFIDHQETDQQTVALREFRERLADLCREWESDKLSCRVPKVERYREKIDFPKDLGNRIMGGLSEQLRAEGFPLGQVAQATIDSEPPPWPAEESSFEGVSDENLGSRLYNALQHIGFKEVTFKTAFEPWCPALIELRPDGMDWETFYGLRAVAEEEVLVRMPMAGEFFYLFAQKVS